MTTTNTTNHQAAADRVRKYVEQRTGMRGLDPDVVHEMHVDHEREARLTLSDLRALLGENERLRSALEKYGQHASDCATLSVENWVQAGKPAMGTCTCGLAEVNS